MTVCDRCYGWKLVHTVADGKAVTITCPRCGGSGRHEPDGPEQELTLPFPKAEDAAPATLPFVPVL